MLNEAESIAKMAAGLGCIELQSIKMENMASINLIFEVFFEVFLKSRPALFL